MRTTSLMLGLCAAAALMGASVQVQAAAMPVYEFTFASGDFTNTGSLGGSGTITCSTPAYNSWAAASTLSAPGDNPYPGNATLQSLVVPGVAAGNGAIVKALSVNDGGMFNIGHAGAASGMTLSFWLNPTALNGMVAGRATDGNTGWLLMLKSSGGLRVAVSGGGNFDTQDVIPADQIAINTWQFITMSWDPTSGAQKMYRNGVDLSLLNYGYVGGSTADLPSQPMTFGTGGTYNAFDGKLAAIRVANTAYTPAEVAALYASETAPIPEPTSMALLGVGGLIALRRRRA